MPRFWLFSDDVSDKAGARDCEQQDDKFQQAHSTSDAPDYKLGSLARHLGLRKSGSLHRAAADVDLTGKLWLHLIELIAGHCTGDPATAFMAAHKINDMPKNKVAGFLKSLSKPPSET